MYPGSDFVTVTRLATNMWEVEASATARAELVTEGLSGKNAGKMTHEGFYFMPFKFRVVK
jgi:hypothetical protein